MNRVAIDLGFVQIYWYSITILCGVILGGTISYLELKRLKKDTKFFLDMLFYVILFGFIGARLYYVLFNLDYYLANPSEIIAVWNGGLAIHGGIIGGVLTIIVYSRIHKKKILDVVSYIDASTLGLILGQIIGRWGNFFNGEAHGGATTKAFLESIHIPDFIIQGMTIEGIVYHPTFLYESLLNLIGLIILLIVRKFKKLKVGMLLSIYLMWYAVVRFFIESMRTDSLMFGNLKMAQIISIVFFIVGLIGFIISLVKSVNYNKESDKNV